MPRRLLAAALLLGLAACADRPAETEAASTVVVRAVYLHPVFDGTAAAFDHEAIPGVMDAMRMDLPLADPNVLGGLPPGSKVSLRLETVPRGPSRPGGMRVLTIERLPDDTELALAPR